MSSRAYQNPKNQAACITVGLQCESSLAPPILPPPARSRSGMEKSATEGVGRFPRTLSHQQASIEEILKVVYANTHEVLQ